MTFHMSSIVLIRKSFLINPSFVSILFSIFLLCLCILRNPDVFKKSLWHRCFPMNFAKIWWLLLKRAKPLAVIAFFPLVNLNKYGFF